VIARAATPEERSALAEAVGVHLSPGARGIVAVDATGRVRGGVLYDGWTENAVTVHMATSTPMAWRALVPAVYEYPFVEAGRGVVLGYVRSSNTASARLTRHLGFREVHRVRDGFAQGDDLILFELRREDCAHLLSRKAA
jgi:L-amino acid N-acyltransferase YncA